jgi:hypothetical protein
MNDDKPKSIWKKSWKGSNLLGAWLILVVASILIVQAVILFVPGASSNLIGEAPTLFFLLAAVLATIFFGAWLFVRWLCCWKNFRRFLFGLACLATLIAVAYVEEDWRGKHDWEKFKRQWEAKGEKFDYASVIPPPVPDDQNFAMAPIWVESMKAVLGPTNSLQWFGGYTENGRTNFVDRLYMSTTDGTDPGPTNGAGNWQLSTVTDLKPWQDYYRTLATRTNLFPIAPQPQSPAQDVLLALSKYDLAIEELREASRRFYSRFPLDYDTQPLVAILLPHLTDVKRCSQVLRLRAVAEVQMGQSDKALADVKLMLSMANSIRDEPFLISHLVRIAIVNIALQPIYEGLADHKWSDAQLADLERELTKLDLLSSYKVGMRGEMVLCQIGDIEYLRRYPEQIPNLAGTATPSSPGFLWLIPDGWFYQNELNCARMMLEFYLPAVDPNQRIVSPSAIRKADTAAEADVKHVGPYNVFERMILPALGAASKKFAWAQESVDLARVAIALEHYRLARGEYPESLDALAPQFMAKIPHDIIGGQPSQSSGPASQPLHYRRTSDGQFVLYSVGWNETDDGGVMVLYKDSSDRVDISKGDWVWRYPSKAE